MASLVFPEKTDAVVNKGQKDRLASAALLALMVIEDEPGELVFLGRQDAVESLDQRESRANHSISKVSKIFLQLLLEVVEVNEESLEKKDLVDLPGPKVVVE